MIRHLTMTAAVVALSIALGTGVHAHPNGPTHTHNNYKSTSVTEAAGIAGQPKSVQRKLLKKKQRRILIAQERIASTKEARKTHKVTIKQGLKAGDGKAKHAAKGRSKKPISDVDNWIAKKEIKQANKKLRILNKRLRKLQD